MVKETETWKQFPEDARYSVSTTGWVKNNLTGKITRGHLRQSKSHQYYYHQAGKGGRCIAVHYMVLRTFVGERPEGYVCDHINRNTLDNSLSNLRYVDQSTNNLNKDACEILRFDRNGNYLGSYPGWQAAADDVNLAGEYLRKRMNPDWCRFGRYADYYVRDSYYIPKRKFKQKFTYIW